MAIFKQLGRLAALDITPRSRLAACSLLALALIASALAGASLDRHYAASQIQVDIHFKPKPTPQTSPPAALRRA